jgi:c-di-GMP-related signal transduction protein
MKKTKMVKEAISEKTKGYSDHIMKQALKDPEKMTKIVMNMINDMGIPKQELLSTLKEIKNKKYNIQNNDMYSEENNKNIKNKISYHISNKIAKASTKHGTEHLLTNPDEASHYIKILMYFGSFIANNINDIDSIIEKFQ